MGRGGAGRCGGGRGFACPRPAGEAGAWVGAGGRRRSLQRWPWPPAPGPGPYGLWRRARRRRKASRKEKRPLLRAPAPAAPPLPPLALAAPLAASPEAAGPARPRPVAFLALAPGAAATRHFWYCTCGDRGGQCAASPGRGHTPHGAVSPWRGDAAHRSRHSRAGPGLSCP